MTAGGVGSARNCQSFAQLAACGQPAYYVRALCAAAAAARGTSWMRAAAAVTRVTIVTRQPSCIWRHTL